MPEFDIQYEPHGPMKTQFMVDFLEEFGRNDTTTLDWWTLYVDGASNIRGSGVGIILEGPDNITLEQALKLNFRASNKKVEYEALITGLKLAREVGAKRLRCYTNLKLVQGQVVNTYQTMEVVLPKYCYIA